MVTKLRSTLRVSFWTLTATCSATPVPPAPRRALRVPTTRTNFRLPALSIGLADQQKYLVRAAYLLRFCPSQRVGTLLHSNFYACVGRDFSPLFPPLSSRAKPAVSAGEVEGSVRSWFLSSRRLKSECSD